MNLQFWKSKRVFVTGHTGFKGSWLSLLLRSLDTKVSGYALQPNTKPSLFEIANIASQIETSTISDIRDLTKLKAAIDTSQPEIIFHLAAQPLVRYSYEHPIETYETNVLGTVNILEAMRSSKTAKVLVNITTDKCYQSKETVLGNIIHDHRYKNRETVSENITTNMHYKNSETARENITTNKCYENKEWDRGHHEEDPLGGHDPYSSSKACAELVTAAYRLSYFNGIEKSIATARAGNVIGGGDWATDRLIPDVISAFLKKTIPLIRYPHAIRPWQHVLEPLCGYLTLAEKMWQSPSAYSSSWNFGPRDEDCKCVHWVVDMLCELWGHSSGFQQLDEPQPHEAHFLKLDISKAKKHLHWQPQWNIHQALQQTVSWYQEWNKQGDLLKFTLNQIASYLEVMESINA